MPILHSPGLMIPGQLGPMSRVLVCSWSARLTLTMSCWGMPSAGERREGVRGEKQGGRSEEGGGGGEEKGRREQKKENRRGEKEGGRREEGGRAEDTCDADDEIELGVYCIQDGLRREGRWDVNDGRVAAGSVLSFPDRVEDRKAEMGSAPLARSHSPDHLCAVRDRLFRVKRPIFTRDTLRRRHSRRLGAGGMLWLFGW